MGVWYSLSIPLWEADNEPGHYQYADYIARNRSLLQAGDPQAENNHERIQPPLYYVLVAGSIVWIERPEGAELKLNPYFFGLSGLNYAIHTDEESFPYRGTALAVHVGRLVSVFLSLAAVIFVYSSAKLFFSNETLALTSAAVFAFWPQFVFTGSVITNDVLIVCLSSIALYLALSLYKDGQQRFTLALLTITLVAAFLTKANAFGLVPVFVWATGSWISSTSRSTLLISRLWILGVAFILVGLTLLFLWFSPFNILPLIGDTIATRLFDSVREPQASLLPSTEFLMDTWANTSRSFFGLFGWGNIPLLAWQYNVGLIISIVAALGFTIGLLKREGYRVNKFAVVLLHTLGIIAVGFGFALFTNDPYLFPGRYALPALASTAILLVYGWNGLVSSRLRRSILSAGIVAALLAVVLTIPSMILAPAYQKPAPLTEVQANPSYPLDITLGEVIELVGYDLLPQTVEPGEQFEVVLYFRGLKRMEKDYSLRLELVSPTYAGLGGMPLVIYPGQGNYPTSLWDPDTVFRDRYSLRVPLNYPAPSIGRIYLALFDSATGEFLDGMDAHGNRLGGGPYFGNLKVRADTRDTIYGLTAANYVIDGSLKLSGYSISLKEQGLLQVSVEWDILKDPTKDYTVFVHLSNERGELVAQHDSRPLEGRYPTQFWEAGEHVMDTYLLRLASASACGRLQVQVGAYETRSLAPVQITSETGRHDYAHIDEVHLPC